MTINKMFESLQIKGACGCSECEEGKQKIITLITKQIQSDLLKEILQKNNIRNAFTGGLLLTNEDIITNINKLTI